MEVVRDTVREAYPANGVSFKDAQDVSPIDQLIPTGEEDPNPITY
jgi:hypothetical protein